MPVERSSQSLRGSQPSSTRRSCRALFEDGSSPGLPPLRSRSMPSLAVSEAPRTMLGDQARADAREKSIPRAPPMTEAMKRDVVLYRLRTGLPIGLSRIVSSHSFGSGDASAAENGIPRPPTLPEAMQEIRVVLCRLEQKASSDPDNAPFLATDADEDLPQLSGSLYDDDDDDDDAYDGYYGELGPDQFCCGICFDNKQKDVIHERSCCGGVYCKECMQLYVRSKLSDGIVNINCARVSCTERLTEEDVLLFVEPGMVERYQRLKTIHDSSGAAHLCPSCSKITPAPADRSSRKGTLVVCDECSFPWCFECESPWHASKTCRDGRKSSKDFKRWLRTRVDENPNAQRCPKCRIPIQRSSGCNNMTCSQCQTHFCYRCGHQQHDMMLIGDHHSKLSVLGCKYNFMPNKPIRRKAVRGSILVAGVTLGVPLCIGGGALLIAGVVAISPFYGTYKIAKKIKQQL